MICNICGTHESTIHLTEIINNQMIEVHLCEECAQQKGTDFKTHFNFGDLLAGLSEFGKTEQDAAGPQVKCSECGMTYDDFTKSGRLGCSHCYTVLSKMLMPLIKRVQRSTHHLGKKPSKIDPSTRTSHDLRLLQERLRKCVQDEEFEEAARLRDEIKKSQEKSRKEKK